MEQKKEVGMTIGEKLRNLRKKKDLTLDKLAQITGIAKATLSRIENNVVGGNYGTLKKISGALGVSLADLSAETDKLEAAETHIEFAVLKSQLKDLTKSMMEICQNLGIDLSK
jgi:transcriptional regulator with XRE-family HTH domain